MRLQAGSSNSVPSPRPISEYDPGVTTHAAMAMDHGWITISQIACAQRAVRVPPGTRPTRQRLALPSINGESSNLIGH